MRNQEAKGNQISQKWDQHAEGVETGGFGRERQLLQVWTAVDQARNDGRGERPFGTQEQVAQGRAVVHRDMTEVSVADTEHEAQWVHGRGRGSRRVGRDAVPHRRLGRDRRRDIRALSASTGPTRRVQMIGRIVKRIDKVQPLKAAEVTEKVGITLRGGIQPHRLNFELPIGHGGGPAVVDKGVDEAKGIRATEESHIFDSGGVECKVELLAVKCVQILEGELRHTQRLLGGNTFPEMVVQGDAGFLRPSHARGPMQSEIAQFSTLQEDGGNVIRIAERVDVGDFQPAQIRHSRQDKSGLRMSCRWETNCEGSQVGGID